MIQYIRIEFDMKVGEPIILGKDWVVCSNTTAERPYELFDYTGFGVSHFLNGNEDFARDADTINDTT